MVSEIEDIRSEKQKRHISTVYQFHIRITARNSGKERENGIQAADSMSLHLALITNETQGTFE